MVGQLRPAGALVTDDASERSQHDNCGAYADRPRRRCRGGDSRGHREADQQDGACVQEQRWRASTWGLGFRAGSIAT